MMYKSTIAELTHISLIMMIVIQAVTTYRYKTRKRIQSCILFLVFELVKFYLMLKFQRLIFFLISSSSTSLLTMA